MPWSPVPGMKNAVRELGLKGFKEQVDVGTLRRELVRQTGSTRPESLNHYLSVMEDFGLIKSARTEGGQIILGIFRLCPENEWEL